MKDQLIIFIALFLSMSTIAQTDSLSFNPRVLKEKIETIPLKNAEPQTFIYGKDTITLAVNCRNGLHFLQPTNPEMGSVEVVDSIDVNKDGTKELFLFRKWTCAYTPSRTDQFCVGCETNWNEQYEVWDVKNNHQLLEFKSGYRYQRIVSTNVIDGGGYAHNITIDKKGAIHFEKLNTAKNEENTDGTYKYDIALGEYILKH